MLMRPDSRAAVLRYEANGYRVVVPGAYVECAITGERIALEALRYWSVARQEPYASAEVATRHLAPIR